MEREFVIRGIHPAHGRVVETTVRAMTELDARNRAEAAGLTGVVVAAVTSPRGDPTVPGGGIDGAAQARARNVLIVDTRDKPRTALAQLLEGEGYEVIESASADDALEVMRTSPPSLVITDLRMPGMDGLAFLAELRRDKRLAEVPVIVFGESGGEARESSRRAGARAFVERNSLDWVTLRLEIIGLIGQGTQGKKLPNVRTRRERDAG